MTYTLIVIFFVGGLEYGRIEMPGWESLAQCENAGMRVKASMPEEVQAGQSLSYRVECPWS